MKLAAPGARMVGRESHAHRVHFASGARFLRAVGVNRSAMRGIEIPGCPELRATSSTLRQPATRPAPTRHSSDAGSPYEPGPQRHRWPRRRWSSCGCSSSCPGWQTQRACRRHRPPYIRMVRGARHATVGRRPRGGRPWRLSSLANEMVLRRPSTRSTGAVGPSHGAACCHPFELARRSQPRQRRVLRILERQAALGRPGIHRSPGHAGARAALVHADTSPARECLSRRFERRCPARPSARRTSKTSPLRRAPVATTSWIPSAHAFGHFDRLGNYRDLDNGVPVDASDTYRRRPGLYVSIR